MLILIDMPRLATIEIWNWKMYLKSVTKVKKENRVKKIVNIKKEEEINKIIKLKKVKKLIKIKMIKFIKGKR